MQRKPTNKRVALQIPEINDGEAVLRVVVKICTALLSRRWCCKECHHFTVCVWVYMGMLWMCCGVFECVYEWCGVY